MPSSEAGLPLLLVVEGINDIQFLKVLSGMLHRDQGQLPDLAQVENQKHLLFLPVGGSNLKDWSTRIATFHKREFHLYDHEQEPETSERRKIVQTICQRAGCTAVLTGKRALENYLHPLAILSGCGVELRFDDNSDVPNLLARRLLARNGGPSWQDLPYKGQRRLREKAKRLLNGKAVEQMTPELLRQQDREGEVVSWLRKIDALLRGCEYPCGGQ
jgi:putative ATP-dependent endonuclease of OLD family